MKPKILCYQGPNITAPGVDMLAVWPPKSSVSGVKADKRQSNFNITSGISMACPHASAAVYGAAQINLIKAVTPGLVYDISESDYVRFLCAQSYNTKILRNITNDDINCKKTKKNEKVRDLNLPSFALKISMSKRSSSVFHRTVTNVGATKSVYKAKVIVPSSLLTIQVTPDVLSFSSVGEKKSFAVTIEGSINVPIVPTSLIWKDGK